jgi:hypothetical protein
LAYLLSFIGGYGRVGHLNMVSELKERRERVVDDWRKVG